MAKNKLRKFEDIRQFANVIEFVPPLPAHFEQKGRWKHGVFGNENDLLLELACGKGDYAVALGKMFPDKNFIGIDIKGSRIWNGAKKAIDQELENVRFVRMYIDHIAQVFAPGEVNDIWITFPDPYLRESDEKKRLTSPKFLELYREISETDCRVHLKTDDPTLHAFTLDVIKEEGLEMLHHIPDVYASDKAGPELTSIQTYYEKKHIKAGRTIRYLCFRLFKTS